MVDNDIYNSKSKYEHFKKNLKLLLIKPENRTDRGAGCSKYYCKNPKNLKYYETLFALYESKDLSYVRRNRLNMTFKLIIGATDKDLADISKNEDRNEINKIVAFMHQNYKSPKSKSDFMRDIKHIWRNLFPERDIKGRVDETLVPYVVRHLSARIDKSKEKRRNDKLTIQEFRKLVQYFSDDKQMQFYIALATESLVRPQEACYLKMRDIEFHDNYAKIYISEHGKEGVFGFLRCIDSFPFLLRLLEKHPYRDEQDAYLLTNKHSSKKWKQQSPISLNKKIKIACQDLGINKPVTPYSLKRNGVSFLRLAGYSDAEIQHIARWKSTKQLPTYDLTDSDDTFNKDLIRKGLISEDENNISATDLKKCSICGTQNSFISKSCSNCMRPLDKEKILVAEDKKDQEVTALKSQLEELKLMVTQIVGKRIGDINM